MKKTRLLTVCLALLLLLGGARAEIHVNELPPENFGENGLLRFTAMPLGPYDGFLLECGGQTMLIDGGVGNAAKYMTQLFGKWRMERVDWYFNTHPHRDHIDGVQRLVSSGGLAIGAFLSPYEEEYGAEPQKAMVQTCRELGVPYRQLRDREQMRMGEALLTFFVWKESESPNNRSMLLRVDFGECSMLLTADIEARAQQFYARTLTPEEAKVDVFKIPHHGYSGLDPQLFGMCSPALTFVSLGPEDAKLIARHMRIQQIPLLHSANGLIILASDGRDWYANQYPEIPERYPEDEPEEMSSAEDDV